MGVVSVKAIVNEVEFDLELNETMGLWEAESVAPAKSSYPLDDHYYGVTVIATDEAGNEAVIDATDTEFGETLRLVVKEAVAPEITVISPTEGEATDNPMPAIDLTVKDDDPGVDPDTISLTVDGTEIADFTIVQEEDIPYPIPLNFLRMGITRLQSVLPIRTGTRRKRSP